jgi:hypothetical protein
VHNAKVPPRVNIVEGIIVKSPGETRGNGGEGEGDGQPHRCGEPTGGDFPLLTQQGGYSSTPHPVSACASPNPRVGGDSGGEMSVRNVVPTLTSNKR